MPFLQRKNITQPRQALALLADRAQSQEPDLGQTCPVLHCTDLWPQKTYTDPCEQSSWTQIFSPHNLPTEKNPFIFWSLTKDLPISSLIYLWLIYPHYVLAPPITSISIFLFQLWILMPELLKPAPIFLWGADSRTSGTVVNDRKNIINPILISIWLQFCCLHFDSPSPNYIKFWMISQHPYHHSLPLTPVITIYFL